MTADEGRGKYSSGLTMLSASGSAGGASCPGREAVGRSPRSVGLRRRTRGEVKSDDDRIVIGVAIRRAGVDRLLRGGFVFGVVIVVNGLVGVHVPRFRAGDLRGEARGAERVIEVAEFAVKRVGIAAGAFGRLSEID